jgi:hypothetical protein
MPIHSRQVICQRGPTAVEWTEIGLTGNPANEYPTVPGGWINQPAWALTANGIYYHQLKGPNSPQDWPLTPPAESGTNLGRNGGPSTDMLMTYDASTNKLIGQAGSTGIPAIIWEGSLSLGKTSQQVIDPFVVRSPTPTSPVSTYRSPSR